MAKKQPEKTSKLSFWLDHIETYEREFSDWEKRAKKIIKRYKDDRKDTGRGKAQFNILWSNVQTLIPALYANPPKPNISRRFEDDDDLGLFSSRVLERSASYFVTDKTFDDIMGQAVLDRLLGGRGTAWVRYEPVFSEKPSTITDDVIEGDELEQPEQELYSEDVVIDYVHYQDFGHTWARTWQEVRAIWRKVYLDRAELVKRFGEETGNAIPIATRQKELDGDQNQAANNKACIFEIWDKRKKKAIWLHKEMPDILDEQDDPLQLKGFFPCPKPLYATLCNDNLVPTPDYILYQDQAIELDKLTGRIDRLVDALRVAGVYDKSAEGVERLLSEGTENKLIPVDNFAVLGEKGGLEGIISWFPIEQVVKTLSTLYDARDRVKADLYEISGISDIIRGASNPNETATAQQIKGQYASLRLDNMQGDVARFARDLVQIITEIIAEHFDLETVKQISGIKLMTEAEKQQVMMAQQTGQEIPEEVTDLASLPSWENIEQVLRDDMARCFKIEVETDSTIKADQQQEQQARIEFLTAAGSFIQQSIESPPELQPLVMEMLMFGVRGFKVGKDLESTMKTMLMKLRKKAEQPQPEQPNPEMAKVGLEEKKIAQEGEKTKAELTLKQQELGIKQQEVGLKQEELGLKKTELLYRAKSDEDGRTHELTKERINAKTKVSPDLAMSDPDLNNGMEVTPMQSAIENLGKTLTDGLMQMAVMQAQSNQQVIAAVTKPKKVVRGKDGKIAGVE